MITDKDCAALCAAIYGYNGPTVDPPWVHYDAGEDDGVCWAIANYADCYVIVFRGSRTFEDWIRDLIALANPFVHNLLGPVHPGFFLGLDHAWQEIRSLIYPGKPIFVTGHSLGAGRAAILCGLMIEAGVVPTRRVGFGEPKPGFSALGRYIQRIPAASYRNSDGKMHDLVTDVPFSFPPEEYVHPCVLTDVTAVPKSLDWGPFSYHHVELYAQALGG